MNTEALVDDIIEFLVKSGMLDAREEYHADDILNALVDNYGPVTVKQMTDRFLSWKLPEDFAPDGGISFKRTFNEHTAYPMKHEPYGTNLLNFHQAEAMVRHMLGTS